MTLKQVAICVGTCAGHNAHGHISTAANSNHQDHFEEISSSSNNGSESPHKGTNGAHQGAHQKGKVSDKKAAVAGHGMDHFDETLRDVSVICVYLYL